MSLSDFHRVTLPEPDAKGNYPAVEYAKASLARKIIRDRVEALAAEELSRGWLGRGLAVWNAKTREKKLER